MLGKLYQTVAIVSIATMLACGGLVGLLYGTGKLTGERVEMIAGVLRADPQESVEAEAAEAEGEEAESEQAAKASAEEELRRQRRDEQLRRALGDRAYRDLVAQRRLVEQALQHLITEEEQFERSVATWNEEQKRRRGQVRDEGFEKECKLVAKLPAKLAKEHVLLKWKESPADVVRLFNGLSESSGKRILEQMKSPEEVQVMHELLERLSEEGQAGA